MSREIDEKIDLIVLEAWRVCIHMLPNNMACQTDINSDCLYHMVVFSHNYVYCENITFFTRYERAMKEKVKLQEKIDTYQTKEKEYWKGRVHYPECEPQAEYNNPMVEIIKVMYRDFDKVSQEYIDAFEKHISKNHLMSISSSGKGCWFDYLKSAKKGYDNKSGAIVENVEDITFSNQNNKVTQTMFPAMYVVTDFYLGQEYYKSRIIGIFSDPQVAHDVQGRILASYGMDQMFSCINDKHHVELCAFVNNDCIDPDEPKYRWS